MKRFMHRIDFNDLINKKETIDLPDEDIYRAAKLKWDGFAKPLDGLGLFEDITCRCAAIYRDTDISLKRRLVVVMCADNGIVKEGVSQSGQDVTVAVARAMGRGESSVCKMAQAAGADIIPIDIGINTEEEIPGVVNRKISHGTASFIREKAMSREQVIEAIQIGMDIAMECADKGYSLIACGEMGIGNTTTSSACIAAMLKMDASAVTGRGAGLGKEALLRKTEVIRTAIEKYELYNADVLYVLECVGGLDIAGLCGLMIGGACYHIPVVLDGVITLAAALAAVRMFPQVREYLIASHTGRELAMAYVLKELGLEAVIKADMALGEGCGAVMLFSLLDDVMALYNNRTTFSDMDIEQYKRPEE